MGTQILFENATGILKDMQEGFKNQVYQEQSPLWKLLKASSDKVQGQSIKFSAQVEEPQGAGSRNDNSLPTASSGEYIEATVRPTRFYGVLEFDSMMLKAAEQNKEGKASFVNFTEQEMKGIKNTMTKHMARQVMGSKKGFMAPCGTTSGSLIVQLATTAVMRKFAKNMEIDLVYNTGATIGQAIANGSKRYIAAVDVANKRITLASTGGTVTTDSTVSVTMHKAYGAEMTGLEDIVSATADIYGITTASYPRWKGYVNSSATALATKTIGQIALASAIEGGEWSDIIVSSPNKMQQIWYALTGTTTFDKAVKPGALDDLGFGYWKINCMFEGHKMEWISEVNCPEDKIYGLRKEDLSLQHLADPEWMKEGENILLNNAAGTSGTASYKSVMEYYPELICMRRNSCWVWDGVTDLSGW